MKIQEFINKKNKYKVDYNYQRPVDVWSNQDNQCLIDTILRGEPIPMFFFNAKTDEEGNIVYYVVDGQQRLLSIIAFIGKQYRNEDDKLVYSKNNNFKLKKLKIFPQI